MHLVTHWKIHLFVFFGSVLIVSLMPFINKPDSASYLTTFMVLLISSFSVINFVCLATASADAVAAVNPNGIKTFLANGLSTFTTKNNPDFSNGPTNLRRNHPACLILWNRVFDNFILSE